MALNYDVHSIILSNIYSIEDQINYCEAHKIEYDFNNCEELKDNPHIDDYEGYNSEFFIIYNDDYSFTSIKIYCGNIVEVKVIYIKIEEYFYCWDSEPTDLTNMPDNDVIKKFNNNIVFIYDVEDLYRLEKYLYGVKKIYIKHQINTKIDDELRDIMIRLNVYGNLYVNDPLLAYDIGLFKTFLTCFETSIYRRVSITNNLISNNDMVENLLISLYDKNNMLLKILQINFSSWFNMDYYTSSEYRQNKDDLSPDELKKFIEIHTINIHTINTPKLRVIFCKLRDVVININMDGVIIRNFLLI